MSRFAIYLLAFGAFLLGTSDFVIAGILEIIAHDLDVSVTMAGQLVTTFSISFVIGSLFLVALTARYERKKVLLLSLLWFACGNVIAFFSYSYELLILSRIVLAMSGGLYSVLASSYAARLAPPGKQGAAIAKVITGFSLALVLGVPLGTWLAASQDWRYVFLYLAIITVALLLLMSKLIPKASGTEPLPFRKQLLVLRDKRIISGLLTTLFWITGYTMVFTYVSPLLRATANFSIPLISTALLALGIFALVGASFGGVAVDKWGPARTITMSLFIHALALFLFPYTATTFTGALLTIMVWGAATWTTTPANQYYLISLNPHSSEIILSYQTAILNLGITIGAMLGGLVIQYLSVLQLGWMSGLMVLLALGSASYSFKAKKPIPVAGIGRA